MKIDEKNKVTLVFDTEMKQIELSSSEIKVEVQKISTGLFINFKVSYKWMDAKTIEINCTNSDALEGSKKEIYKVTFD